MGGEISSPEALFRIMKFRAQNRSAGLQPLPGRFEHKVQGLHQGPCGMGQKDAVEPPPALHFLPVPLAKSLYVLPPAAGFIRPVLASIQELAGSSVYFTFLHKKR